MNGSSGNASLSPNRQRIIALLLCLLPMTALADARFAKTGDFTRDQVTKMARELAESSFEPLPEAPEYLRELDYDEYRAIRFRPDKALWADSNRPYRMQLFHPGVYFNNPVEIAVVEGNKATHLSYSPDLFTVEPPATIQLPQEDIGFAGLRLHTPLNKPDIWDELVVFQGASYFRSIGRHQNYGLSARGLAVKTGAPEGEEFPVFRAFWVEKPSDKANSVVVHALLDSESLTGAYRFTIRPGDQTMMDVEATLFPRVELDNIGLAPGTSMYYFSQSNRQGIDDFRPQVHDSDGLLMVNGRGERIWRPLANPSELQISAFMDTSPIGFGLMQRDRDFAHYQDLEAQYETRPSLWVEPVGDWGEGEVVLTEIPTNAEIHDNIVAFWKPATPLEPQQPFSFAYRLSWGNGPQASPDTLKVLSTRQGRANIAEPGPERLFVIDYAPVNESAALPEALPEATLNASAGRTSNLVVRKNPKTNGYRVSFQLDPQDADLSELSLSLKLPDQRQAEAWVYRWTAE
ncbi:glucan biosynthesis protein G [Marinobacterium lutimaris]|uniref:Glucans biosynthesis protein n=1 Tax=Marinobacterium lutimaris TaxID=568106 RepID=A0A1H6DGX0_9GAMM|nr:glucan biosynthesis protein G [Marinobacterium lutimaris]SEG84382.1 glucans biosynthesis protein [Marinobacterium lutimaris]